MYISTYTSMYLVPITQVYCVSCSCPLLANDTGWIVHHVLWWCASSRGCWQCTEVQSQVCNCSYHLQYVASAWEVCGWSSIALAAWYICSCCLGSDIMGHVDICDRTMHCTWHIWSHCAHSNTYRMGLNFRGTKLSRIADSHYIRGFYFCGWRVIYIILYI